MASPSDIKITLDFKGFDKLVNAIKRLPDDATKRRELLKIFKRQAKPYVTALKSGSAIPKAERDVPYYLNKDITYKRGNLRRSIKVFANKRSRREKIYIHVGPSVKKAEGSGYYGHMILPGVVKSGPNANKKKTDWRKIAWNQTKSTITSGISRALDLHLRKSAQRLGFETSA